MGITVKETTMSKHPAPVSRRGFLNRGAFIVMSIPLATISVSARVRAAEKAKLDPKNPLAESLAYTHDAANSARASDSDNCRTCLHVQGGADDAWGGCNIFSDNVVNANGWCNAYNKRE
ncbi:MAG TPA: high-potential iron-sulfur protein [Gammaproteobacteria bacterium]